MNTQTRRATPSNQRPINFQMDFRQLGDMLENVALRAKYLEKQAKDGLMFDIEEKEPEQYFETLYYVLDEVKTSFNDFRNFDDVTPIKEKKQ